MKKDKIMFGVLLGVFLVLSAGITIAYFTLGVQGNENAKNITATVGNFRITYNDGNEIIGSGILPSWTATKNVTVYNNGTSAAYYALGFQKLINTFINGELLISATCNSTGVAGDTCEGITERQVPATNSTGIDTSSTGTMSTPIKEGIYILPGATHTYTITFTFIETGSNQNYNQGKVFNGKLAVAESSKALDLTMNFSGVNDGTSITMQSSPRTYYVKDGSIGTLSASIDSHTLSSSAFSNTSLSIASGSSTAISGSGSSYTLTVDQNTGNYSIEITVASNAVNKMEEYKEPLYKIVKASYEANPNKNITLDYLNPSTDETSGVYKYTKKTIANTVIDEPNGNGTKEIYYYRGNVTNNNVIFANKCWLMVRTTDTGGVKLLYNGTPSNGTCPSYRLSDSNTPFIASLTSVAWDSSSPYSVLYKDAEFKSTLETWYSNNLSSYDSKLEDIAWCNDADGQQTYVSPSGTKFYPVYTRLYADGTPQLECAKTDTYYKGNTNTNLKLNQKIALLTADEAVLAGQSRTSDSANKNSYIDVVSKVWWLLTPYSVDVEGPNVLRSTRTYSRIAKDFVYNSYAVRASVSLSASVKAEEGNGSIGEPYIVE